MGLTSKGEPNGLATLDADGKLPTGQLPSGVGDFEPGEAVADVAALTSSDAAGETPTDEEYDALRADVAAIRTTVNALLASLRAAGLIAES
ncbi:hypothetical protein [Actinomadura madurae]|uniref:hypothetical protein n=1 Tax=Actinomadura madurae TaxID=1993 RepID=UPI0020D209D4|nr:hypothetical protein [Actinomadura madurae]MCP9976509.1 hypothetical protein [Actinomadura madurae]